LALVVPLVVVVVLSFCRRQINCPYYAPKVDLTPVCGVSRSIDNNKRWPPMRRAFFLAAIAAAF